VQVCHGLLDLSETTHAQDRDDRLLPAGDDDVRAMLCVGDQAGDASLGGLGHAHLTRVTKDRHTWTVQKPAQKAKC
jgi:hypothetical protein